MTGEKEMVVAFRGTDAHSIYNWAENLRATKTDFELPYPGAHLLIQAGNLLFPSGALISPLSLSLSLSHTHTHTHTHAPDLAQPISLCTARSLHIPSSISPTVLLPHRWAIALTHYHSQLP